MTAVPFFSEAGQLFEPQAPAQGYWNRAHQNGVAVGGLLALLCDTHQATAAMRTCRLTVDIQRGVPFQPIEARCRVARDGGRVQMLEAEILADGVVVARASALRIRVSRSPASVEPGPDWPSPEAAGETPLVRGQGAGSPLETRMVRAARESGGGGAYWTRSNSPIVEGRITTPLTRVVMAADIAGGAACVLDRREWSFANLDLTTYLARPPVDDWIFAEATMLSAGDGAAVVQTQLGDRLGRIGVANQVLYVAPRAPPAAGPGA